MWSIPTHKATNRRGAMDAERLERPRTPEAERTGDYRSVSKD
jgi:hypothetical protein